MAHGSLPPDRGGVSTERRHPRSSDLDALDALAITDLMIDDHVRVTDAVRDARAALASFIDAVVERLRNGGRLIYLGAGTSGRLGVLDASECPPTFQSDPGQVIGLIAGGDAALRCSSEAREDDPDGAREELERLCVAGRDVVLGIAAGGTTPYVHGGIAIARARGAMTGLLTCAPVAAPPAADHLIVLDTGPELLTGSTRLKAGSATKLALNIISTAAFVRLGKTYGNFMVDLRATNDKLRDRALRILMELNPRLSRVEAAHRLDAAGGELKTALVMARFGIAPDAARRLLDHAGGRLRDAFESVHAGLART
jgi:N-acetylmuramic acid 6-phosphate etherase